MFDTILQYLLEYVIQHRVEVAVLVLAFIRLCGTTIQSGSKGVFFVWGRAKGELDPGFHFLIPVVQTVRKTHIRSITVNLPKQRVTTADGLVYDVDANVVYRIVEPMKSMLDIDDIRKGCETVLPLIAQDILRGQTRAALLERKTLDEEFAARAESRLARWGVKVEQAGFQSIAPTPRTLRLTQLSLLAAERNRVFQEYLANGLPPRLALALLGTDRQLVGHAVAHYRKAQRRHPSPRRWQRAARQRAAVKSDALFKIKWQDKMVVVSEVKQDDEGFRAAIAATEQQTDDRRTTPTPV